MALVVSEVQDQVHQLIESVKKLEGDKGGQEAFEKGIATIIINTIKAATLTIPMGSVVTAGGPTSQTNPAPILVSNGLS